MRSKTPKSALVVKFTTKTGAKTFAKMMKTMLRGPFPSNEEQMVLRNFIEKYHYENELV